MPDETLNIDEIVEKISRGVEIIRRTGSKDEAEDASKLMQRAYEALDGVHSFIAKARKEGRMRQDEEGSFYFTTKDSSSLRELGECVEEWATMCQKFVDQHGEDMPEQ